jgi:hypothetical protein
MTDMHHDERETEAAGNAARFMQWWWAVSLVIFALQTIYWIFG